MHNLVIIVTQYSALIEVGKEATTKISIVMYLLVSFISEGLNHD